MVDITFQWAVRCKREVESCRPVRISENTVCGSQRHALFIITLSLPVFPTPLVCLCRISGVTVTCAIRTPSESWEATCRRDIVDCAGIRIPCECIQTSNGCVRDKITFEEDRRRVIRLQHQIASKVQNIGTGAGVGKAFAVLERATR